MLQYKEKRRKKIGVEKMTDEEKLQKYLPLIRNAAGWTAEELGQKIGVTKQTISNIENNKTKLSKTQYLAIQMVISQKIATTTDNLTLANIMKMVFEVDEEEQIDYSAVEMAKKLALGDMNSKNIRISDGVKRVVGMSGIAGAMNMIGLTPVGAVSAAVLGATIQPWLTKSLREDKK